MKIPYILRNVQWWKFCAVIHTFDSTMTTLRPPLSTAITSGPQCVALKSPWTCAQNSILPYSELFLIHNISYHAQFVLETPWHCYLTGSTPTPSGSSEGGAATPNCATFKITIRPSRQVWRCAWSNMETIGSPHPPTWDITPITQFWASPRPYLVIDGWHGIGSVWPWRLNTPFTHELTILPSSSIRCRPYKYQIRCSDIYTKTCGTYGSHS